MGLGPPGSTPPGRQRHGAGGPHHTRGRGARGHRRTSPLAPPLAILAMLALAGGCQPPRSRRRSRQRRPCPSSVPPPGRRRPARQQTTRRAAPEAARAGYPIRVALIASPPTSDRSPSSGEPQSYAKFLGQELGLVHHGPLLVVMPNGLGSTSSTDPTPPSNPRSPTSRPHDPAPNSAPPHSTAVQKLAAASGHPVPIPAPAPPTEPQRHRRHRTLVVFAAGAVLIGLAWAASFRARPLTRPPKEPSST